MGSRRLTRSDSEQDLKAVFLTVFKSLDARVKTKEDLLFGECNPFIRKGRMLPTRRNLLK